MEIGEREWTNAARAAEQAMKNLPEPAELKYWAGYAHSRLGRELYGGMLLEKARTELETAKGLLQAALRPPEHLRVSQERQLNATCYRAIALNFDALIELNALEKLRGLHGLTSDERRAEYIRGLKESLAGWFAEHPDDPHAESDLVRFENKYSIRVD